MTPRATPTGTLPAHSLG
jgi:hypothetical protein